MLTEFREHLDALKQQQMKTMPASIEHRLSSALASAELDDVPDFAKAELESAIHLGYVESGRKSGSSERQAGEGGSRITELNSDDDDDDDGDDDSESMPELLSDGDGSSEQECYDGSDSGTLDECEEEHSQEEDDEEELDKKRSTDSEQALVPKIKSHKARKNSSCSNHNLLTAALLRPIPDSPMSVVSRRATKSSTTAPRPPMSLKPKRPSSISIDHFHPPSLIRYQLIPA